MTEIFAAVTNRRLAFFDTADRDGLALDVAPQTRVVVTINHLGQHLMTAYADGKTFTRFGSDYTRITAPLHPNEVGGIGPGTEYGNKVADLAFKLAQLPYSWIQSLADLDDPDTVNLYLADAAEIIRKYPHLLSLPERERLGLVFREVAI